MEMRGMPRKQRKKKGKTRGGGGGRWRKCEKKKEIWGEKFENIRKTKKKIWKDLGK